MPVWAKIDAGIHRNPKVRAAGSDGREVFIFLICVNREHEFNGTIKGTYADPAYLAGELQWRRADRAKKALERCVNAGLIVLNRVGSVLESVELCGFDAEWRTFRDDSCARVRQHRAKLRESQGAVTARNGVTVPDQSRSDQSRSDTRATAPVGASGVVRASDLNPEAAPPDPPTVPAYHGGPGSQTERQALLLQAPAVQQFDLLAVYARYPRKRGKTPGLRKLRSGETAVRTAADYEAIKRAVENYRRAVDGKDAQHIQHFSTWCGEWHDWIKPDEVAPGSDRPLSDFQRRIIAQDEERTRGGRD